MNTFPPSFPPSFLQLVEHIDKAAVQAMTKYYQQMLEEVGLDMYGDKTRPLDILDVGASW